MLGCKESISWVTTRVLGSVSRSMEALTPPLPHHPPKGFDRSFFEVFF